MKIRKKFRYGISVLLVFIFALVPLGSVFAYDGGLLNGKTLYKGSNQNEILDHVTKITDGNETTLDVLTSNGSNYDNFWYEFKTLVNISHVQYKASQEVNLLFYDENNIIIYTEIISNLNGNKYELNVSNVKKVVLRNSSSKDIKINEFDVFGSIGTGDDIPPLEVTSLSESHIDTKVDLQFINPTDNDFSHVNIYQDGTKIGTSSNGLFSVTGLIPNTSYTFKVTTVDTNGNESLGKTLTITTNVTPKETIPPGEITNLQSNITHNAISFKFDNPLDEDFALVKVYKDGVYHGHTSDGTYIFTGLDEAKQYSFRFTTVDENGNESAGTITSLTTSSYVDELPPNTPTGVKVLNGSGSLLVTYDSNTELDLYGYNIYVDGVKINAKPVTSRSYTLSGLENDISYNIQVSAVDISGNESGLTSAVSAMPSGDAVPILTMGYSLADVADSVGSWFSNIWLIIAFSVAIPLSFYIASRTKLLFLD